MIAGTSKQCLTFDSYKWWVPLTYTTGTDNNFNKDRADVKWFNTTSKGKIPCMNPDFFPGWGGMVWLSDVFIFQFLRGWGTEAYFSILSNLTI